MLGSSLIMVDRMRDAHIPACVAENTDEMAKSVEVVEENWKSKEK